MAMLCPDPVEELTVLPQILQLNIWKGEGKNGR